MQRAAQTVESYMSVPAGPLPWQVDSDLNKAKESKKKGKSIMNKRRIIIQLSFWLI